MNEYMLYIKIEMCITSCKILVFNCIIANIYTPLCKVLKFSWFFLLYYYILVLWACFFDDNDDIRTMGIIFYDDHNFYFLVEHIL